MTRKILSTFLPAALDACALYRMFLPHLNIPYSQFVFRPGPQQLDDFAETDVIVVQRQATANNYVALQRLKEMGYKLVYDLDDNLWSIPYYNPARNQFNEMRMGIAECIKLCDIVTVSTQGLCTAVKTELGYLKKDVMVVPNAVDFNMFHKGPVLRDDGMVVIGWAGSNTHRNDVTDAWEAIEQIVLEDERVRVEITGGEEPPKRLAKHPRCKIRPWVPVAQYPGKLGSWGWDIIVAPLEENRFNKSKSNIKLLEAAAVGAAVLASDVQPYHELCSMHDSLKWCLCSIRSQWYSKLKAMIEEAEIRVVVSNKLREVVQEWYDIRTIKDNWQEVFRRVCGQC